MRKQPSTWPAAWWTAYVAMCATAHDSSEDQSERVTAYRTLLDSKVDAGVEWAKIVDRMMRRSGDAAEMRDYANLAQPRLVLDYRGRVQRLDRSGSARMTRDDGSAGTVQTLFDVMTWDQIREKVREFQSAQNTAAADAAIALRILELEVAVPDAATPHDALTVLDMTLQDWLDQAAS